MNTTRRTFLKTTGALAATLPLVRVAMAEPAPAAAPSPEPSLKRGLLFDASDLPRMRANLENPRFADLRATLRDVDFAAETKFLREQLRLNNHVADFLRARITLEHAAFAYAVWGDKRQLDLVELALRRLLDYKRWDYFLEGGKDTIGLQRAPEATIAVLSTLDWVGDALPADLRAEAEHQVATKGAPACFRTLYGMKYPDRVRGWGIDPEDDYQFRYDLGRWPLILNATNLKVIPICGLGYAAIWFHGRHPDADKWMQLARQSAQAFSVMYGLDGAYDEGVGYWGYTTQHLAMFAEALHRRLGIDDRKLVNYPGTIRYALALVMPCDGHTVPDPNPKIAYKSDYRPDLDLVNFSDAATGMDVTVAAWVGRVANDPLSNYVGKRLGGMRQLPAVVWYDANAPEQEPGPELHDVRLSNDWVVSRTGWKPADGVVGFRSGGPSNHEHADRNSVVFKVYGDRLFHDPFHAGYSPTLTRWKLRQTSAHTAVLINGRGHQYHDGREGTNSSWANAHVVDFRTGSGWMTVTSDATDAYALVDPKVDLVTRTLLFLKPDVLVILDHVKLKSAEPVQVRFQVFNEDDHSTASASGLQATIQRPQVSAQLTFATTGDVALRTGKLDLPDSEGAFPFLEAESATATEHTVLTVTSAAPKGQSHGSFKVTREGTGWRVQGQHSNRTINAFVGLTAAGAPDVKV